MCGVSRIGGLVAAPTTVYGVRPHWMLRQLAQPARDRARELLGSLCHLQFRAWRGLVLELSNKRIHARASTRTPATSSPRPTGTWASRTGPRQLARALGGIVTSPPGHAAILSSQGGRGETLAMSAVGLRSSGRSGTGRLRPGHRSCPHDAEGSRPHLIRRESRAATSQHRGQPESVGDGDVGTKQGLTFRSQQLWRVRLLQRSGRQPPVVHFGVRRPHTASTRSGPARRMPTGPIGTPSRWCANRPARTAVVTSRVGERRAGLT